MKTEDYLKQLEADRQKLEDILVSQKASVKPADSFTDLLAATDTIEFNLQSKTIKPSANQAEEIAPDKGFDGLSEAIVAPIDAAAIPELKPEFIKTGATILGVVGTYGPKTQDKTVEPSAEDRTILPDEGYEFMSSLTVRPVTAKIDSNILPENIRYNKKILGVTGTFSIQKVEEGREIVPSLQEQIITPSAGFDCLNKAVLKGVTPDIDANITAENIKKGVNILGVEGSYEQVPLQEKTIKANVNNAVTATLDAGYEGFSKINVEPIKASDIPNLTPDNIKKGVKVLDIQGTMTSLIPEERVLRSKTEKQIITPTGDHTAITKVVLKGATSDDDPEIIPENIRINKTIMGVRGTYTGGDKYLQDKNILPSPTEQIITPDAQYDGLNKVTIGGVVGDTVSVTPQLEDVVIERTGDQLIEKISIDKVTRDIDKNIVPENIKKGVSILGVNGTFEGKHETYFDTSLEIDRGEEQNDMWGHPMYQPGVLKYGLVSFPETVPVLSSTLNYAFAKLPNLRTLPLLDYSKVTSAECLLDGCDSLVDIDKPYNFTSLKYGNRMVRGTISDAIFTKWLLPPSFEGEHFFPFGNYKEPGKLYFNMPYPVSISGTIYITGPWTEIDLRSFKGSVQIPGYSTFISCGKTAPLYINICNIDITTLQDMRYLLSVSRVPEPKLQNTKIIVKDDRCKQAILGTRELMSKTKLRPENIVTVEEEPRWQIGGEIGNV